MEVDVRTRDKRGNPLIKHQFTMKTIVPHVYARLLQNTVSEQMVLKEDSQVHAHGGGSNTSLPAVDRVEGRKSVTGHET